MKSRFVWSANATAFVQRRAFSWPWVAMWAFNVALLAAFAATKPKPLSWVTAAVVLFVLPEMIGLRVRGDALPPLTYVIRRYVKRWIPTATTVATAVWIGVAWWPVAVHPLIMVTIDAFIAGWLINHWDVTYDGPGE